MRNPIRKSAYCVLALIVAAMLILFAMASEQPIGENWAAIAPLILGFAIAPIAFVTLIQALLASVGHARLLAGKRVIARWHLCAAEWERFRELDARRSSQDPALANDLCIRKRTPAAGVDVIIGEKSLIVDRSYHVLRPRGLPELRGAHWLEGSPACLEFPLVYPRGRFGGLRLLTLRIPVPGEARAAAQRVLQHFEPLTRRRAAIALRNPAKTQRVCLMLFLFGAAMAAAGYALVRAGPGGVNPMVPLVLIIGAVTLAIFAVILSLATFALTRRS